jgi:hypothetical protein
MSLPSFASFTAWLAFELGAAVAICLILWALVFIAPPVVIKVDRLYAGATGLALPVFIFVVGDSNDEVLRHELAHHRQMRRYSPLGVALFLGAWYGLGLARRRRHHSSLQDAFNELWDRNPLEKQANKAMKEDTPLPRRITIDARTRRAR